MKKSMISRRGFLTGVAATAATVTIVPRHAFGANDRLNGACIGVGGKGGGDSSDLYHKGANIVALCDASDGPLDKKHKEITDDMRKKNPAADPGIRKYKDFRKMFDEMAKDIDIVTVSTPDHTHFPAAMCAILNGKHIHTQKPMTHNIWEARRLAEEVKARKLGSLMGIQGHANDMARNLCEWVWAGAIGNVTEVHYWTNRPIWAQGMDRPKTADPVPASLDWDVWLNVAPMRPYNKGYCPFSWRGWWDFGAGAMGDIGCHVMDAAFWALDLRAPSSIEAQTSDHHEETAPKWSIITYQFPARGPMPPCKVIWHDGGKMPPRPKDLEPDKKINLECGAYLFGDKGTLWHDFYCDSARIIPETKHKEANLGSIPKTLPRCKGGHMGEWVTACKTGIPMGAHFQYAAALTEMVHLGNIAVRSGQKIEWDAKNMKVTNFPEANKWMRRTPRKGWEQFYKGADVPPAPTPEIGQPKPA